MYLNGFNNARRFIIDRANERAEKIATVTDKETLTLSSLDVITDALLEIMEVSERDEEVRSREIARNTGVFISSQACSRDIPNCNWLSTWTELAKNFAFCYNPALQPRALIVYGCICKRWPVFEHGE